RPEPGPRAGTALALEARLRRAGAQRPLPGACCAPSSDPSLAPGRARRWPWRHDCGAPGPSGRYQVPAA
ncbi:hypothetical protein, partial [Hymenobacter coccineus]|uniref:hypothetical protein n=1 Tax=Hymenobacter coccineus TaxID=1908235 RepID=UPI001955DA89